MISIRFRLLAHKDSGLRRAPEILSRNLTSGLEGLGKRLRASAEARMREDTRAEIKSLRILVRSRGMNKSLEVSTDVIRAFVDAYGLKPGTFPNTRVGSPLYRWADRKARGIESKRVVLESHGVVAVKAHKSRTSRRAKAVKSPKRIGKGKSVRLNAGQRQAAKNRNAGRLAFLAARSIFERGIQPTYWNSKALEANRSRIISDIKNALSRAAVEINRG